MIKRTYRRVAAGLILGIFVAAATNLNNGTAYAASNAGPSITTSPISVALAAMPGTPTSTVLHVQNNNATPITIGVKLEEFKAKGTTGQAQIYTPPKGDASSQWVHFSQSSFVAQPGVWQPVTMTVSLPKTAAFGYYYAALFYPEPTPNETNTTNTVKDANAVFVLVNAVSPNAKTSLDVAGFSVNKSSYQYLPVSFNINVRNNGNVFTMPSGNVFISRTPNGPSIDTLIVNNGQGNVLPGTNRVFQTQWTNGFPNYQPKRIDNQVVFNKDGSPVEQLQWNFTHASSFRFGKYYAKLVLVYNNGTRDIPVTSEVSFWVIPWFLLAGIALFAILMTMGIWTIIRNTVRIVRMPRKRR